MKTVEFTDDELRACREMLNVALKTLGGQVARAYLVLDAKLRDAKEVTFEE